MRALLRRGRRSVSDVYVGRTARRGATQGGPARSSANPFMSASVSGAASPVCVPAHVAYGRSRLYYTLSLDGDLPCHLPFLTLFTTQPMQSFARPQGGLTVRPRQPAGCDIGGSHAQGSQIRGRHATRNRRYDVSQSLFQSVACRICLCKELAFSAGQEALGQAGSVSATGSKRQLPSRFVLCFPFCAPTFNRA